MGLQGLLNVVEEIDIFGVIEIFDLEQSFGMRDTLFRQSDTARLLIDDKVRLFFQARDDTVYVIIKLGGFFGRSRK